MNSFQTETQDEVAALQKESELPIEELIENLPKEILEKPAPLHSDSEDGELASKVGNSLCNFLGIELACNTLRLSWFFLQLWFLQCKDASLTHLNLLNYEGCPSLPVTLTIDNIITDEQNVSRCLTSLEFILSECDTRLKLE